MLIDGKGMTINAGMEGIFELTRFKPVAFSGDWHVTGHLTDGPVHDFNLFFDRSRMNGTLEVVELREPSSLSADGGTVAVHLIQGAAKGIAESDTLVLNGGDALDLEPTTSGAVCAVARVYPIAPTTRGRLR
jgi:environmental stress-induced protein Ves